jgi:hypothetical protein
VLDVEQDEYLPTTMSAGFNIIIHDPFDQVFPSSVGYTVAPGTSTSFAVSVVSRIQILE